ncbi:MAG: bifunctional nicotinamidase/pyrazinamidase [Hyphomicrobiales bacterium]|nr:bifunctional nicotinamidase/pyrazinamidase [Hyphomicrobiales bacterium]MCP4997964.1 bifunctional nicotinamidase/pyrazinamidase [Hyphomicrobiales bacterium]
MTRIIRIEETDALLVIDVQNDFCPGGALEVPNGDQVVGPANRMIDTFSTVVLSQDWHPGGHQSFASSHDGRTPMDMVAMPYGDQVLWPDHCVQGSSGADFHADLNTHKADLIVRKGCKSHIDSYSAFFENDRTTTTGLGGYLKHRGIRRIFLLGLAAEYCVGFSALDGLQEGFEVFVFEDAVQSLGGDHYHTMHKTQRDAGIRFITTTDIKI